MTIERLLEKAKKENNKDLILEVLSYLDPLAIAPTLNYLVDELETCPDCANTLKITYVENELGGEKLKFVTCAHCGWGE